MGGSGGTWRISVTPTHHSTATCPPEPFQGQVRPRSLSTKHKRPLECLKLYFRFSLKNLKDSLKGALEASEGFWSAQEYHTRFCFSLVSILRKAVYCRWAACCRPVSWSRTRARSATDGCRQGTQISGSIDTERCLYAYLSGIWAWFSVTHSFFGVYLLSTFLSVRITQ